MPRFNGTGPLGFGPGTGWGMGPCGGGVGWRRGWRRGWGRGDYGYYPYPPQITKKEEAGILEEDAEALERELKVVKERLAQLKGKK